MESIHYAGTSDMRLDGDSEHLLRIGSDYGILAVHSGGIQCTLKSSSGEQRIELSTGDLCLVAPGGCSTLRAAGRHAAAVSILRFRYRGALLSDAQPHPFRMPQAFAWLPEFAASGAVAHKANLLELHAKLLLILAEYVRTATDRRPDSAPEAKLQTYVEKTMRFISEHYAEPMDVESIARSSGCGVNRFYQAFRLQTGLSPHKYITAVRLNEALRLLAGNGGSVMEVAHSLGYQDELYFSRLFKKHMGMSPSDYAECASIRIANLCPVFAGDLDVLGLTPALSLERGWKDAPEEALKRLKQCRPDLILTSPVSVDLYDRLAEIAPVFMLQWKGMSWKDRLTAISERLGMPSVAKRWFEHFERKADNARQLISRQLGREPFLLVAAAGDRFRVFGKQRLKMKDLFYDDLRIEPPAPAEHIAFLDAESLADIAELECDNALFFVHVSHSEEYCRQLVHSWQRLKRGGSRRCLLLRHAFPLHYNPIVHERLLDLTVKQLAIS